jgi:hypothetical protein
MADAIAHGANDAERKKLSHVGTVTWRSKTLKRKTDALNHVGSGDWLGCVVVISSISGKRSRSPSGKARRW